MPDYSMTEIVEMAVQTERLGYAFYTGMAERFRKDDKLAELFTTLAEKEKWHEKVFGGLLEDVDETVAPENWEEAQSYFRAVVESEFFLGSGKALPEMAGGISTVAEAVDFALGFEKETILYFIGIEDAVGDRGDTVRKIIDEEKSHVRWLSDFKKRI